jgi:hypothetical protein
MKPPVLLCYNLPNEKSRKIKLLCMRMSIRVHTVAVQEYGQTLVALCGMEPMNPAVEPVAPFTDELIVLAHFPQELLSRFLYGFRKDGIEPVLLKAVLTETNSAWNSVFLHDQLLLEHTALAEGKPPAHPDA